MKKIISILVAILMITTSVSVFAIEPTDLTVAVNAEGNSVYYSNNLDSIADGTGSSVGGNDVPALKNTGFTANKDHPADFEFKNGALIVKRPADSTKSGLTYINFSPAIVSNSFVFGYDLKFDNIAPEKAGGVFNNHPGISGLAFKDDTQEKIDKGELVVGITNTNKAYLPGEADTGKVQDSQTAWLFYGADATSLMFTTKEEVIVEEDDNTGELASEDGDVEADEPVVPGLVSDENGNAIIFHGDAQLIQGKNYSFRVYVNNGKYYTAIIDDEGNVQKGVSGNTQKGFTSLGKIDTQLSIGLNNEASVTLDNIYAAKYLTLDVPGSYQLDSTGTIEFGATIPEGMTDVKVLIGGKEVGDVALTEGAENYTITAKLPEGTQFGKTDVTLTAKHLGRDLSTTATTDITLYYAGATKVVDTPNPSANAKGLRKIDKPADPVIIEEDGAPAYWAIKGGEVDVTSMNPPMKGIVKFSFDFKTPNLINQFRMRMTASTAKGTGLNWHGSADGTADPYEYFINGHPQNLLVKKDEWNTFSITVDFYSHTYKAYLNGKLLEEDFFTDVDEGTEGTTVDNWTDRVADVRLIMNSSEADPVFYLDNFKFEEMKTVTAAPVISYSYSDGTSANYTGEALTAVNLNSVNFALAAPIENITAENTKVVDAFGNTVDEFEISFADSVITAAYNGEVAANGDYRLVIGSDATMAGVAIGNVLSYDFAFLSEACILSPVANSSNSGAVTLSAFTPYDGEVKFFVNDSEVAEFNEDEVIRTFEYTPEALGVYTFDVYYNTPDGIKIMSETFQVTDFVETLTHSNSCDSGIYAMGGATGVIVEGAGKDGGKAFVMTSKVGTLIDDAINKDTSNSNTTGFAPNKLYRKMYTEFEVKPGVKSNVSLEIGYGLAGKSYAEDATQYKTLYVRGCQPGLFNANDGKNQILGTDATFTPDTWYKVCQLIDLDNLVCQWNVYTGENYETLVVSTNDDISGLVSGANATAFPNWKEDIVVTTKYKVNVTPANFDPKATEPVEVAAQVTIDNMKRYQPENLPEVKTVNGDSSYIIEKGSAIAVELTKAYDYAEDDVNSFSASSVEVFVNGALYEDAAVTVADGANFTVSGLDAVAAGSKVEIKVSDAAFYAGTTIDKELIIPVYVAKNDLYVAPFTWGLGGKAMAKYVNVGDGVDAYVISSNYVDGKLAKADFTDASIEPATTGVIEADASGECVIRLWAKDSIAPLTTISALEAPVE